MVARAVRPKRRRTGDADLDLRFLTRGELDAVIETVPVRKIRFHDPRHTFATMLAAATEADADLRPTTDLRAGGAGDQRGRAHVGLPKPAVTAVTAGQLDSGMSVQAATGSPDAGSSA
jgi:hypothetical protein